MFALAIFLFLCAVWRERDYLKLTFLKWSGIGGVNNGARPLIGSPSPDIPRRRTWKRGEGEMASEVVWRRLVERRRRGFFGWIFLLLFWGFNALMFYSIVKGVGDTTSFYADPAMRKAHDVGTGLAVMIWLVFWAAGAVIFGLLAHFTRGRQELIEVETKA
jgi:hypothetical protein